LALGFSPYRRQPGVLNAFIRYETIYTAIQYHSFALSGIPYMGVGRNLAYDKRLFMRDHGFEAHAHVLSGDDDLFVNRVARAHNTVIVLHPDAFVFSEPQSAWRGYYYQKRRHLGAGRHYKPVHQALLGLLAASHCGHYGLGLILLCGGAMTLSVLIYYLVRIGVVSLLGGLIARKLGDPSLRPWIPLFDAAFVWYYFLFAPALIGNIKQWKQ
jgi:biofilm PGA synthesis N-glycosyltransferase PgaC